MKTAHGWSGQAKLRPSLNKLSRMGSPVILHIFGMPVLSNLSYSSKPFYRGACVLCVPAPGPPGPLRWSFSVNNVKNTDVIAVWPHVKHAIPTSFSTADFCNR